MRLAILFVALAVTLLLPAGLASGQVGPDALQQCAEFAFSTEEDFYSYAPEPIDGNPLISDGDLLGPGGAVCARNYDLLHDTFDVDQDMGLDAADVIDAYNYVVAFSTELDSPHGNFTAGDLLIIDKRGTGTVSLVIPNTMLTAKIGVGYDIGLDAVHFVGVKDEVLNFIDAWAADPGVLSDMLSQRGIDIWFSTEGTWWPGRTAFLDGDLLSAATGNVVAEQRQLPHPNVPAGIRDDAVDFGLDAFAAYTRADQAVLEESFFSTEVLYDDREGLHSFTDGDVLEVGNGIFKTNKDLVVPFEPRAFELGLDALSLPTLQDPPDCYAAVTALGGTQTPFADVNAVGMADMGYPTRHPFGNDVPFWGYLADCVDEFRVVYRAVGDTGDGTPIVPGTWMVGDPSTWNPATHQCQGTMSRPSPGTDQYYDADEYRYLLKCDPLPFTNWHTPNAPDPNGTYEVRIDWKSTAGTSHGPWHTVQLDNEDPEIVQLAVEPQAGGPISGTTQCPIYSPEDMPMMLRGEFKDEHFWQYRATIDGDLLPAHAYTLTRYYDGTPAAANLDDTGTYPDGTLVDLHDVSVYDLTAMPPDCCYSVQVRIWDRTIWGSFAGYRAVISGYIGRWDYEDDIYFAFVP
jgi:hypothetical protein